MKLDKDLLRYIKIYVIGSLVFMGSAVALWGYYIVSRGIDSSRLVDSQIKYQEALATQVGKPTTVNYVYPSMK